MIPMEMQFISSCNTNTPLCIRLGLIEFVYSFSFVYFFFIIIKREKRCEKKKNRKYLQISTDEIVSLFFIWINLSAQWNRERDKLNKLPKKPIQYNVYAVRTVQTITTVIDGWWSESNERRIGKI